MFLTSRQNLFIQASASGTRVGERYWTNGLPGTIVHAHRVTSKATACHIIIAISPTESAHSPTDTLFQICTPPSRWEQDASRKDAVFMCYFFFWKRHVSHIVCPVRSHLLQCFRFSKLWHKEKPVTSYAKEKLLAWAVVCVFTEINILLQNVQQKQRILRRIRKTKKISGQSTMMKRCRDARRMKDWCEIK